MSEGQPLLQDKPPTYHPTAPETQPYIPPPQGGYQAAAPQTTNVTVVHTVPTTVTYGEGPCAVTCPTCHNQVTTSLSYETGGFAWIMVFVLFLIGWLFPILWWSVLCGMCMLEPLTIEVYIFMSLYIYLYLRIFLEPLLSARKLLQRRVCDQCETRDYYGVSHGECHKRVDGR